MTILEPNITPSVDDGMLYSPTRGRNSMCTQAPPWANLAASQPSTLQTAERCILSQHLIRTKQGFTEPVCTHSPNATSPAHTSAQAVVSRPRGPSPQPGSERSSTELMPNRISTSATLSRFVDRAKPPVGVTLGVFFSQQPSEEKSNAHVCITPTPHFHALTRNTRE